MRFFIVVLAVIMNSFMSAQLVMPAATRADLKVIMELTKKPGAPVLSDFEKFPVAKLRDGLFLSLMGKVKTNPDWPALLNHGAIRGSLIKNIATVKVPIAELENMDLSAVFSYVEMPGKIFPDLDHVLTDVHADSVHHGWDLPQAYTGKDVLIGVTDWGFDYTQPMFYDTLLQQTRIVAAWDQFKIVGNQPQDFGYGVEYNAVEELLAANGDTANIYSFGTHGTHVAGIAGGSGIGTIYRGMAPEAGFLFTTFLVDAASVIDAFTWMKSTAQQENKRLVINMSWGLYYIGTLDGNSLLSQAIDALSEEGVVFVSSAGNNGANDFHIKKVFNNDLLTTRIQFDSYTNPTMWGESITMWGEENQPFSAGIKIYSSVNALLAESPLYATESGPSYLDSMLVTGNDTIFFNLTIENAHPLNGRPHMRLRVKNTDNLLRVVLNAEAESGIVHFWNLVELTNGVGNWGLPFVTFGGSTGMAGDSNYSIGEPTCTASAISVAAYSAQYINVIGNLAGGQIASFTSIGPLMTEVMKPDIAAPGVNVVSSISSFTDASYSAFETVNFEGVDYDFAKFSGTSMSSPCVTGIVALLLDANPLLSSSQIKQILQATAREDNYTGEISAPGDTRWGYGKVNAYQAVKLALETIGTGLLSVNSTGSLYPNPAHDILNVFLSADEKILSISAIEMHGKRTSLDFDEGRTNVSKLAKGLYTLEIVGEKSRSYHNVIIQ